MAKENNLISEIVNAILKESFYIVNKTISENITSGDFVNIFPKTLEERKILVRNISRLGKVIDKTNTGEVYLLDNPITSKVGPFSLIKIRMLDLTRTQRGAPDFKVKNYSLFKKRYIDKDGFSVIDRKDWEVIELRVPTANVLIYFPNETLSESLTHKHKLVKY